MKDRLFLLGSLAPLSAGLLAIEACTLDRAGSCTDPGGCYDREQVSTGPRDSGGGSEADAGVGCSTDVDCDDGNPCTTDTCEGGACVSASVTDGKPIGGTACLPQICQEGVATPSPAPAGEPCEDGGTCDGAGACLLPLGGDCSDGAQCGSGHCIEGMCCGFACDDECETCDPITFECAFHATGTNDPDCGEGTVCTGGKDCKLIDGQSCTSDDECLNQNCDQSGDVGVCQ